MHIYSSRIGIAFFSVLIIATTPPAHAQDWYTLHWQATVIPQGHPVFSAAYSGTNSVMTEQEGKTSFTGTVFGGVSLWPGANFYLNPEATWGTGISSARGVAGYVNGETYRIGVVEFKLFLARLYLQQTFGLGGGTDTIADDLNQISGVSDKRRLTVTVGKFGVADLFDDNAYSHDPRTQFLNWSLMSAGAWDYPADTRGYTVGAAAEYHDIDWSLRAAMVMEPTTANGLELDTRLGVAHGLSLEGEYRYLIGADSGTVRAMVFSNTAKCGSYREALDAHRGLPDSIPLVLDATRRDGRVKYGFGVGFEQQIANDLGAFLRFSWNDGATETWAFTEIDHSLAAGLQLQGSMWRRNTDAVGIAIVVNGLSQDQRDFTAAGGYGFMIGDGHLNYALETIAELYYRWQPIGWLAISPDYQLIINPGYNADRGPVHVLGIRMHVQH